MTKPERYSRLWKYRSLISAIVIFLLLDIGVLVLNFTIASQFERDSAAINVAGRQRMLSQRITKSLLIIENAFYITRTAPNPKSIKTTTHDSLRAEAEVRAALAELQEGVALFESSLNAFARGGETVTTTGAPVVLPSVQSEESIALISRAEGIWSVYYKRLAPLLGETTTLRVADVQEALAYGRANNEQLLALMNALTNELESEAARRANRLRLIQTVAIGFALLNFALILFRFISQLRKQDIEISRYSTHLEALISERTTKLENAQTELQHLNASLEAKVAERTVELKQANAQLIHSEKMAALGQMVAGLAHEMNTPIGFIKNNLQLVPEYLERLKTLAPQETTGASEHESEMTSESDINELHAITADALSGTVRLEDLVKNLRNFARLDETEMKYANLNDGLDATLNIALSSFKHFEIRKAYHLSKEVFCNPAQLNQVFLNLMVNAAQAMPDGGTLSLTTSEEETCAVVTISDTGSGIAPDHLKKIFEPFFTTKPVGSGTGLGLSISYKIIEEHRGTMFVESALNVGTTFIVKIPFDVS
jgi:two-component system, NtrC family, sensor kinase